MNEAPAPDTWRDACPPLPSVAGSGPEGWQATANRAEASASETKRSLGRVMVEFQSWRGRGSGTRPLDDSFMTRSEEHTSELQSRPHLVPSPLSLHTLFRSRHPTPGGTPARRCHRWPAPDRRAGRPRRTGPRRARAKRNAAWEESWLNSNPGGAVDPAPAHWMILL